MTNTLRQQLKADLTAAMKTQNKPAVMALRAVLAEIDHAEAVDEQRPAWEPILNKSAEVPRKVLTESDIWHIFETEIAARQTAVAEYDQLGQTAEANQQRLELAVLTDYLTRQDRDER